MCPASFSVDVNNIGILNSSEQKDLEERGKWVLIFILKWSISCLSN